MKNGILLAGNILVDYIKIIDSYPNKLSLTQIRSVNRKLGGLVGNVGIDLSKIDGGLRIYAMGYVGDDADGKIVVDELSQYSNIDCSLIKQKGRTTFTDVMTVSETGERTFFTYQGADSALGFDDFNFDTISADLMHIGYIMLLDGIDAEDAEYGTVMAKILHAAQQKGIRTSIDVVSESSDRFKKLVIPALKYSDYCTINELEAEQITNVVLRDKDGILIQENMEKALRALKNHGVKNWVTIHAPEGAFGLDEVGNYIFNLSKKLPKGFIKDSVGAGDAFVAGLLYSAYNEIEYRIALSIADAAAIMSLSEFGATNGVCSIEKIRKQIL